ncbi:MAG: amidohydrolase family protein, partial [Erysipelotrichaceae bacterium]|nr:amidohydrolase family protein [Erysipelotrichaceae bacterium]
MKTLYYNGTVYDGSQMAEAFIVEDGRFIFCGSNHEAEKYGYDEKTDLKGQFVCAGFNDSHLHLLNLGQSLMSARLAEHTDSLRGMMNYVREFRNSHDYSSGQWLTGRGWNQDYFTDVTRMPSRKDIDDVVNDIPVVLTRACGHSCVVNTRALEVCGITEDTVSPDGGAIDYEKGLFFDNAIDLISRRKPLPSETEIENMIIEACRLLNSYGITSVQSDDYCVFREIPFEVINEAYRKLEREGRLSV